MQPGEKGYDSLCSAIAHFARTNDGMEQRLISRFHAPSSTSDPGDTLHSLMTLYSVGHVVMADLDRPEKKGKLMQYIVQIASIFQRSKDPLIYSQQLAQDIIHFYLQTHAPSPPSCFCVPFLPNPGPPLLTAQPSSTQPTSTTPQPTPSTKRAEALKLAGNQLFKQNLFEEALTCYSEALQLHEDAIYHANRATALCSLHRFPEALVGLRRASRGHEPYPKAHARMGQCLASLSRHTEAMRAFEQAVRLDPNNSKFQEEFRAAQQHVSGDPFCAVTAVFSVGLPTQNFLLFLVSFLAIGVFAKIGCRNEEGDPVDWWIVLKAPRLSGEDDPDVAGGWAYYYIDSTTTSLKKSFSNLQDTTIGAFPQTLNQLYSAGNQSKTVGYMFYNDQPPGNFNASSSYGHTKGVTGFDATSAFWILHSVPRTFNPIHLGYYFRKDEVIYGQSAICLTLGTSMLNTLGSHLQYERPFVYESHMPEALEFVLPNILDAMHGQAVLGVGAKSILEVTTQGGVTMTGFAKNAAWGKDLDEDLIEPHLKIPMAWETWMRPYFSGFCPPEYAYKSVNVKNVQIDGISWKETQDHSKWGISLTESKPWVCIGGINRMASQRKRGGGAICYQNKRIWTFFNSIIATLEEC
ncbi:putative deoxyribonuclease II family protein [Paratrimastix pyriformis]|uniref:Deoxyribonuclease II family protein n=1 Tax=Paratrimastix pyriformis TaxID=342808 RepID=A0ABQ8UXV4_9EUKA|nr:putative deoxyribonuclease II family protein [Paratrimastix pyriformis]